MGPPTDHKQQAIDRLRVLRASVEAQSAHVDVRELMELIGHLERAVQTFHMEAIRFRMYTMGRRLTRTPELPAEIGARFEQVRESLEAAGFHTRSVSS
jgi:hypothetical protein